MSRLGNLPVIIPPEVKIEINNLEISVIGPKGSLIKRFNGDIVCRLEDNKLIVAPTTNSKSSKAMWGTARNIINWMVKGVSVGFETELDIIGVGYRASVKGSYINLSLGKSHNTKMEIPKDITVEAPKQNSLFIRSIDKQKLGQFVASIIRQRPPEPYKGKGINPKGKYIERKDSKKK